MLLEKTIELFVEYMAMVQKSQKTIRNYHAQLISFNNYLCEIYNRPVYLEDVTAEDLDKYLFNVLSESKYSSSYRHVMITAFKSLFNFCTVKDYCTVNVGKLVKFNKVYTKERIYISEFEFVKIAKHIEQPTVRALLQTIFYTGLRLSETINLKISDVNLEHEHVFVRDGKGRKDRMIPINDKLKKILTDYLSNDRVEVGTDNFFSCRTGKISTLYTQEVLRKTIKVMGIEQQITPHVLRHAFASNLIERGVDLFRVQKLLGHENMKTTSIYLHTNMEELEKAVNML